MPVTDAVYDPPDAAGRDGSSERGSEWRLRSAREDAGENAVVEKSCRRKARKRELILLFCLDVIIVHVGLGSDAWVAGARVIATFGTLFAVYSLARANPRWRT